MSNILYFGILLLMKLLLHSCCAPCSTACIEALKNEVLNKEKITPVLFWYNPNVHPFTEYQSRKDSLVAFALEEKLDLLMEDEYGLRFFLQGMLKEPGSRENFDDEFNLRCNFCYRVRLEKTALLAREKGYDAFSTTLLTSPHQKHDLIRQYGEECSAQYGIDFYYMDFRPWYNEGRKKAREKGRYMQKYCGCIFSEEERYLQKNVH